MAMRSPSRPSPAGPESPVFDDTYEKKAERLKQLVMEKLWGEDAKFFKVLPRDEGAGLVDVRELHGFTPWYLNLPQGGKAYEVAWKQLMDPDGFLALYGPTTVVLSRFSGIRPVRNMTEAKSCASLLMDVKSHTQIHSGVSRERSF